MYKLNQLADSAIAGNSTSATNPGQANRGFSPPQAAYLPMLAALATEALDSHLSIRKPSDNLEAANKTSYSSTTTHNLFSYGATAMLSTTSIQPIPSQVLVHKNLAIMNKALELKAAIDNHLNVRKSKARLSLVIWLHIDGTKNIPSLVKELRVLAEMPGRNIAEMYQELTSLFPRNLNELLKKHFSKIIPIDLLLKENYVLLNGLYSHSSGVALPLTVNFASNEALQYMAQLISELEKAIRQYMQVSTIDDKLLPSLKEHKKAGDELTICLNKLKDFAGDVPAANIEAVYRNFGSFFSPGFDLILLEHKTYVLALVQMMSNLGINYQAISDAYRAEKSGNGVDSEQVVQSQSSSSSSAAYQNKRNKLS